MFREFGRNLQREETATAAPMLQKSLVCWRKEDQCGQSAGYKGVDGPIWDWEGAQEPDLPEPCIPEEFKFYFGSIQKVIEDI